MKPSIYNLGSVKVTESSQFYNAKYIKGYPHMYQKSDKPQFQGEEDEYKSSWLNSVLHYINILEGIIH